MKKLLSYLFAGASLIGVASAQVTLDNFETFNIADWTIGGFGAVAQIADGANSTANSMNCTDAGFSYSATKTFVAAAPAAGNYKVTFFYKNAVTSNPMAGLRVFFNGGSAFDVPAVQQLTWTAAETGVRALTAGQDVTIEISTGNGGPESTYDFRIDEIVLEPVTSVPIEAKLRPVDGYFIAGTTTLTATATGGTGTFTQAQFDIGDNGTVDHTDNTPGDGFTFDLDTTTLPDDPIAIKVTITDDAAGTGSDTNTYNVTNLSGVVDLFADGFESWTGGHPTNWIFFNEDGAGNANPSTGNLTIEQDTVDFIEGASSLKITFAATDTGTRYTYRSPSFDGQLENYILWYWGKGGTDNRIFYFYSDDELVWVNTFAVVASNSTALEWNEAYPTTPFQGFDSVYLSVATHKFNAVPSWWDDVRVTGTPITTPATATNWDLYE